MCTMVEWSHMKWNYTERWFTLRGKKGLEKALLRSFTYLWYFFTNMCCPLYPKLFLQYFRWDPLNLESYFCHKNLSLFIIAYAFEISFQSLCCTSCPLSRLCALLWSVPLPAFTHTHAVGGARRMRSENKLVLHHVHYRFELRQLKIVLKLFISKFISILLPLLTSLLLFYLLHSIFHTLVSFVYC